MEAHSIINVLDLAVTPERIICGSLKKIDRKMMFISTPQDINSKFLEKRFSNTWTVLKNDIMFPEVFQHNVQTLISFQPLQCHCDYPQPPDADLITVDHSHYAEDVKCNAGSDGSKTNRLNRSRRKSLWKLSKKCVTNFFVYICRYRVCF